MSLKRILLPLVLLSVCAVGRADEIFDAFLPVCDSLTVKMQKRSGVAGKIGISKIMRRGNALDFYFSKELVEYPWRAADISWFKSELKGAFPSETAGYILGEIFTKGLKLEELATPELSSSGQPVRYRWKIDDPRKEKRFIEEIGARRYSRGLDRRYIALWQSHGRYYDEGEGRWAWQRAPVFCTVEDLYTQSYVLPFLMPMLENAGAYVMSPRERDTNRYEVVADNDKAFDGDRIEPLRQKGSYSEKGEWSDAGEGFADAKRQYSQGENPFTMGSARQARCSGSPKATASAVWKASFPERGRYAVYISYKSLPFSTSGALYKVNHLGGQSRFIVNQKMGGGTWIYLGTFEFDRSGSVELDNSLPDGRKAERSAVITADAVRFGGGMGKVERGGSISGMPAYAEGSSYSCQWAGFGKDVCHGWDTDYTSDYAGRGVWVKEMKDKRNIPFDLSLAFHSDAGVTPNDSIVGTLAIYTLKCEGSRKNTDGSDRMTGRLLADYVQTQIVNDIRKDFNPDWTRRGIWDRSYSESRTTDVPAMLLELLSHQNYADMQYGHDPAFRFTVCRAVYKGILKFISELYGCPYTVQPLPVEAFSVVFAEDGKARLSWKAREDKSEPTAKPAGYTVYTRIDGGAFDKGVSVKGTTTEIPIQEGHLYSFKVEAWNEGGKSFPSETLSMGIAPEEKGKVLIVNGFTRVSAPEGINSPDFAGFNTREDHGVPYIEDIQYIGDMYDFSRSSEWISNRESGFGATYSTRATEKMAGNSFDFPAVHGAAVLEAGYSFCSESAVSFKESPTAEGCGIIDLIFGKQKDVFEGGMLEAIGNAAAAGTSIIISGSNIGAGERADTSGTARRILGYRWVTSHASPDGIVGNYRIVNAPDKDRYCVENPDGIRAASSAAETFLRYSYDSTPAAVRFKNESYKAVSYGFPIEALDKDEDIRDVIRGALNYIEL